MGQIYDRVCLLRGNFNIEISILTADKKIIYIKIEEYVKGGTVNPGFDKKLGKYFFINSPHLKCKWPNHASGRLERPTLTRVIYS